VSADSRISKTGNCIAIGKQDVLQYVFQGLGNFEARVISANRLFVLEIFQLINFLYFYYYY
jgi:hypothetical protein